VTFLGAENVMDQVEAVLQVGMTAAVATVNAAYTDDVAIAVPLAQNYRRIFDPADQSELDTYEYPLVVIRPEPESVEGDQSFADEYAVSVPVEVSVVVGYDVPLIQQKQLLRYMRAVKTILAPQASLACGQCKYAGGGFARTWTTDSGVVRDVSMVFLVTVFERP
jgi:hypothetical protein